MNLRGPRPVDASGTPLCAYCGNSPGTTDDHVVARCIFPTPPPPNLVTVPACAACNEEKKAKDDTFLRDFLTSDYEGHDHPVASQLFEKVRRAAQRNQSELAKLVQRTDVVKVPIRTPAGLYVGELATIKFPPGRLDSIIFRIVRGLYYDSRHVIFPETTPYVVLRHPAREWNTLAPIFRDKAAKVFGDLFACSYMWVTEDQFTTLWLIGFYQRYVFSVQTGSDQPPACAETDRATAGRSGSSNG